MTVLATVLDRRNSYVQVHQFPAFPHLIPSRMCQAPSVICKDNREPHLQHNYHHAPADLATRSGFPPSGQCLLRHSQCRHNKRRTGSDPSMWSKISVAQLINLADRREA
jgi:hypothetical protein